MKEPYGYEPSQRLENSFVNKNYKNDIITHLGKKGTIIIEDTRGYHKGSPVKKGVRICYNYNIVQYVFHFNREINFLN